MIEGPFRVGEWRVDPLTREVTSGTEVRRLEPKVRDLLLLLAERAGEAVPREEIERGVWSGAAVGTDLLNRAVWKLRRALDDDSDDPRYVETIPRVGYRLVAEVAEVAEGTEAAEVAEVAEGPGSEEPGVGGRSAADHSTPRAGVGRGARVAAALVIAVIVGWTLSVLSRRAPASPGPALRIAPLTASSGYEAAPSVSPDGSRAAYQRYDPTATSPQWDVAVVDVAGRTTTTLAGGPAHEYGPAWSAWSDSVAYVRQTASSCEIVVQAGDGSAGVPVAGCAADQSHEISWLPNGDLVMAASAPGQTLGLVRVDRGSGSRSPVTRPPVGYDGDRRPRVSPDGTRIAFVRQRVSGISDVYVVDLSGDPARRVTVDDRSIGGLAWTPDGRQLVFSSNRGGASQLWRVPVAGGEPVAVPMSGRNVSRLAFAPDGTMVYEEYDGDSDLWTFDPVSGRHEPWAGSSRSEWAASVAPDGRDVLFLSDRTGGSEIFLVPWSGGTPRRLTDLRGAVVDPPRWSPDGTRIVYAAAVDGTFDVFTVGREGGTPTRVTTHPGDDRMPEWWRGGIAFVANRTGSEELWWTGPDGEERRLTSGGGRAPRAVPGGGGLLFTRAGEPGLWILEAPQERPRRVWRGVHPRDWGNWVPTEGGGGVLHFEVTGEAGARILRVDLATADATVLTRLEAEAPDQAGVTVLPDGRILYARVVRSESDLWIANGLGLGGEGVP